MPLGTAPTYLDIIIDADNVAVEADEYIRNTSLDDALVSYTMEQREGAILVDATGNGNHGGMRPLADSVSFVDGINEGTEAAEFDGTTSYVDTDIYEPWFDEDVGAVTASMWVSASSLSADGYVWDRGNLSVYFESTGEITFAIVGDDLATYSVTSTASYDDGSYHHVVVEYVKGSTVKMWVDDTSEGSTAISATELDTKAAEGRLACRDV